MDNIKNEVFVCLDCETTGLDPKKDKIIEVAAVKFTLDKVLDEFETLVNPEAPIPDSSIAIHHITPQMVVGKPTIGEVLPRLTSLIGNHVIVGHGVFFDMEILAHAMEQTKTAGSLLKNRFLDTLRMARLYGQSPVNSLAQLRCHFGIEACGAHRAMSDVQVNMEVFKRLVKDYKSLDALFDTLSRPILFKTMPLGKHKGRYLKDIPLQYLLWAAKKDFDQDLLYSLRTEIKKRKQGNLFGQVGNPFSQL